MELSDRPDLVDDAVSRRVVDLVQAVFDNGHARLCPNYKPYVSESGTVYCDPCGITVESLIDLTQHYCPVCECPKPFHTDGVCYGCGYECGHKSKELGYVRSSDEE